MHAVVVAGQLASVAVVGLEVDVKAIVVILEDRVGNRLGILGNGGVDGGLVTVNPAPELLARCLVAVVLLGGKVLSDDRGEAAEYNLRTLLLLNVA